MSQNIKLLIVDDEVIIVDLIKKIMSSHVNEIFTAYNGREALKVLESEKDMSLILTDINMPIMDGLNFIKRVREKGVKIPVIFFTGYGNDENMVEALKYGAYDFIAKPDLANLEEIVGKCLNEVYGKSKVLAKNSKNVEEEYLHMIKKR